MAMLRHFAALFAGAMVGVDGRVGTKGMFSSYTDTLDERECTCNCCIREPRRPNEVIDDILYKCSMPPGNDGRLAQNGCSGVCTVVNDPIFPTSTTVETNRFCFYHCEPTSGGKRTPVGAALASQQRSALLDGGSLVDAECVSIRPRMIAQAISNDHNGRDPHQAPLST